MNRAEPYLIATLALIEAAGADEPLQELFDARQDILDRLDATDLTPEELVTLDRALTLEPKLRRTLKRQASEAANQLAAFFVSKRGGREYRKAA